MKWLRRTLYLLAAICIICVVYYRVWFLRQPARNIPHNKAVLVSPANGVVVSVSKWNADTLLIAKKELGLIDVWTKDVDTAGTVISIQMDPTNVHFQRSPADARVISKTYTQGNFNNAIIMSNRYGIRFENEHNEMLFETERGKRYKLIQIAGFLARRIEDYIQPGQQLKQGDVIGLIKLGSQVTVILPYGVETPVKVGDVVTDGETVIGNL